MKGRSFCAALACMLLALCAAVYFCARSERLFADGLLRRVNRAAVDMTDDELRAFASDTMDYLLGRAEEWRPAMRIGGRLIGVPRDFGAHMASVRRVFLSAPWILAALLAACVLLALSARRGFSRAGWMIGLCAPLLPLLCAALWAALDFNGFWGALHYALIPDGVFGDAETLNGVMRLFPPELFADYLPPFLCAFAALALCAALTPLCFHRKALMK